MAKIDLCKSFDNAFLSIVNSTRLLDSVNVAGNSSALMVDTEKRLLPDLIMICDLLSSRISSMTDSEGSFLQISNSFMTITFILIR